MQVGKLDPDDDAKNNRGQKLPSFVQKKQGPVFPVSRADEGGTDSPYNELDVGWPFLAWCRGRAQGSSARFVV